MIHEGQSLSLCLKAGDDLPGVHAQLDNLERDATLDRLFLLGHIDHTHSTLADFLEQLVTANPVAGLLHRQDMDRNRILRSQVQPQVHQTTGAKPLRGVGGQFCPAFLACAFCWHGRVAGVLTPFRPKQTGK
jgi:hypothetical protein